MLTPPENFQTHPKNLDPSRRNPNNPPKNLNLPNMHFSTPPPENISTQKNMLTLTPPPHLFLPLFLHFSKKYENSEGGVPLNPLKYALVCYPLIKMFFSKY